MRKHKDAGLIVFLAVVLSSILLSCKADYNSSYDPLSDDFINNNADLANLIVSEGTLTPEFDPGTVEYTVSLDHEFYEIIVTPTAEDTNATISVNIETVSSGSPYGPIDIGVGSSNNILINVIAEDGTTQKDYKIIVTRYTELYHNASLQDLGLSVGGLSPSFSTDIIAYTAEVIADTASITVTPTALSENASITVNDTPVYSGTSSSIDLDFGENSITIEVTAEDVTTTKIYSVIVTRLLSANADLSDLTIADGTVDRPLDRAFDPDATLYFAGVPNSITSITLTATADDQNASVAVTPSTTAGLDVGRNDITILVTAEDGTTTKTYTVEVYRAINLPKTGQTISYDTTGDADDGALKMGTAWPVPRFTIKGDNNEDGDCLDAGDSCDGTVTDNLTGLIWLMDANCTVFFDGDDFGQNDRSWSDALAVSNSLEDGQCGLLDGSSAGDWRLPNRNELRSLINPGFFNFALSDTTGDGQWSDDNPFIDVQDSQYWSSTTYATVIVGDINNAWHINMCGGSENNLGKYMYNNIWPVRSGGTGEIILPQTGQTTCYNGGEPWEIVDCGGTGQDGDLQTGFELPRVRFYNNEDGTVTDNLTGLMWLEDARCIKIHYPDFDSDDTAVNGAVTWQHALDFVAGINDGIFSNCGGDYTDWRLPNVNELESLIDEEKASPALPQDYPFTNVSSYYWSSTTYADLILNAAYYINMQTGIVAYSFKTTNSYYVLPVRDAE